MRRAQILTEHMLESAHETGQNETRQRQRQTERERERERERESKRDISKVESQLPSCQPYMHDNHSNFILFSNLFDLLFVFLQFSLILDPKSIPKGPQKNPLGTLKNKDFQDPHFAPKGRPWGPPQTSLLGAENIVITVVLRLRRF